MQFTLLFRGGIRGQKARENMARIGGMFVSHFRKCETFGTSWWTGFIGEKSRAEMRPSKRIFAFFKLAGGGARQIRNRSPTARRETAPQALAMKQGNERRGTRASPASCGLFRQPMATGPLPRSTPVRGTPPERLDGRAPGKGSWNRFSHGKGFWIE